MTLPRYYDVTHFLTDPNEICTVYIKLEIKDILFIRSFQAQNIFLFMVIPMIKNIDKATKAIRFSEY